MKPSDAPAVIMHPAAPADLAAAGRLGALLVRMHHELDRRRFEAEFLVPAWRRPLSPSAGCPGPPID